MSNNPTDVKQYFLKINRTLTISLVAILIGASALFWVTKAVTLEDSSFGIGAVFMLLAVLFYQLPYLSFLLTRHHFKSADQNGVEILDSGWKAFKQWLVS